MKHKVSGTLVGLAALGCIVSTGAFADDNPIGLYVGAGAGSSTVRNQFDNGFGTFGPYDQDSTGWELLFGGRPIPVVGGEIEYIDFGHSDTFAYTNTLYGRQDDHALAGAAFAVGYLPLPVPWLDVFGKLGVAELHTSETNGTYFTGSPGYAAGPSGTRNATDLAYGAGAQVHVGSLGLRLQYERIRDSDGDPDLLAFDVMWNF